jgi:[protein-PII] uridylyltransferase
VTGTLALHRLDVRSAWVVADGQTGVAVCRVAPRFGALPDWAVVRRDLRRTLDGELDLEQVLAAREASYAPRTGVPLAPPSAELHDDASETATVLEVRAPDAVGLLHRITAALARCGLDVRTAHISTLGADAVDAFYLVGPDGGPLTDPALRQRVCAEVVGALGGRPRRPDGGGPGTEGGH